MPDTPDRARDPASWREDRPALVPTHFGWHSAAEVKHHGAGSAITGWAGFQQGARAN